MIRNKLIVIMVVIALIAIAFAVFIVSNIFYLILPANATSAYQSGYDHGASDGRKSAHGASDWYIDQPGKGFEFHTQEFNRGYGDGFCANNGGVTGIVIDDDANTLACPP